MDYNQTEYLAAYGLVAAFLILGMLVVCIPRPRAAEHLDKETIEKRKKQRAKEKSIRFDAEQHKRFFWNYWPLAVIVAVCWLIGCYVAICRMFVYQLKELSAGIKRRGIEYIKYDRATSL